ncbi:MAG: acyltransferase family protein [Chthoniobacterales bacterium]
MKNKNADGLRGLASLCVACHHFIAAFLPFLLHQNYPTFFVAAAHPSTLIALCSSPIISVFYNGNFPVMIFFVLSGYVLTTPYFSNTATPFVLHRRLWGRYLRLNIPVAATVLLSYIVYKCHGYFNIEAGALSGSNKWLTTFFAPGFSLNIALKDMLWRSLTLGEGIFNPVFWTLKIELIGSIYVLVFYIAKPKGNNFLFTAIILFLISIINFEMINYSIAIFAGALLNKVAIPKKWHLFLLCCGLYFGAFQYENSFYDFLPSFGLGHIGSFYNTIGAILLITPILNGYGARFFQSRLLQFLGLISFPLYLLHFIVLSSFACALYVFLPHNFGMLSIVFVLYLLVSIALSTIFEKRIDKPAIALSHRLSAFLFR